MADCNHDCANCTEKCDNPTDLRAPENKNSKIKHIYAIVSGKGGVGKSLVTSLLAVASNRNMYKTAILDADITGPSIPMAFNINDKAYGDGVDIFPNESRDGIKVMSANMLLANDTEPVIMRGPMIADMVKQFYSNVRWEDIDNMFIDCPPGTGDVPLTIFQSLPIDGIIIVTSPQELVSMIVAKAANMANMMNIPILGIVENMSYFMCPNCNEKHYIYGESHIEEIAKEFEIDTVVKLPINPNLAKLCDQGLIENFTGNELDPIIKKLFR